MTDQPIIHDYEKHFNEPILVGSRLARLIGYGEDADDYYIIVQYSGGTISWIPVDGHYTWLTGLREQNITQTGEDQDDFDRLDELLTRNQAPRQDEFTIDLELGPPKKS